MKDKGLYTQLVIGTIGMVMIGLGIIRYFTLLYDSQGYALSLIGYAFTNGYIFQLERKAGINKNVIWIQSIAGLLTLIILSFWLYI
ncbi:hypothetical protein D3H55_08965 [Bacillus salacetis]|uniref:Uncharacterized protein n=1 Tax=Bacillus salacetis TaxID=2315464 RepID=A0A3A1QZJ9_9BACI|nr:hypothetical protein [Bacillus salacetis]RIW34635.1 hypothetical protein D3H55_08965 [Bacillus salacetis]